MNESTVILLASIAGFYMGAYIAWASGDSRLRIVLHGLLVVVLFAFPLFIIIP